MAKGKEVFRIMTITEMMQRDAQFPAPLKAVPFNLKGAGYTSNGAMYLPFDIASSLDSLPLYAQSEHTNFLIETAKMILWDDRYHFEARAVPSTLQQGNSNLIVANQQYEDQISVSSGSFLLGIGAIGWQYANAQGSGNVTTTHANYRIRLYDAGAQDWISDDFVRAPNISGNSSGTYVGPFWLPSPLSITSPGQLNVSIVNLDAVAISVEMAFFFAAPNGDQVSAARLTNAKSGRKE